MSQAPVAFKFPLPFADVRAADLDTARNDSVPIQHAQKFGEFSFDVVMELLFSDGQIAE